jgi:protein-disulfide isomerase
MTHSSFPGRIPAGSTPEGDGILVGAGPVQVDAFIDFLCPFCRRFEQAAESVLAGLVSDGQASLAYHPMNFLDEASTTSYSTRAAAASACAADQGRFPQYAHELFAHQPPEGGAGLSDAVLAELGQAAGLDEAPFAACLAQGGLPGVADVRHHPCYRSRRHWHTNGAGRGRASQSRATRHRRGRQPGPTDVLTAGS